jgi:hypothetical protein
VCVENFDQAVLDYKEAVTLLKAILRASDRRLAEAHYKLALALEYGDKLQEAMDELTLVVATLNARIAMLEEAKKMLTTAQSGDDKRKAMLDKMEGEVEEMEELKSEIASKVQDMVQQMSDKGKQPAVEAAEFAVKITESKPVADITSLVRKKPKDVDKKRKLTQEAEEGQDKKSKQ